MSKGGPPGYAFIIAQLPVRQVPHINGQVLAWDALPTHIEKAVHCSTSVSTQKAGSLLPEHCPLQATPPSARRSSCCLPAA